MSAYLNLSMGFIEENFIDPILQGTGYNIYNTLLYGIILIVILVGLIKLFKKKEISLDKKLWYDLLPFVLLGGISRALQDISAFSFLGVGQYAFVTPGIYVTMTVIPLLGIFFFRKYLRNIGIGLLLLSIIPVFMNLNKVNDFLLIVVGSVIIFIPVYYVLKKKTSLINGLNWMPVYAHTLDATSSVIAISYLGGYSEQHVLASTIGAYLPFWTFIPIKIIAILLALYVIDKEKDKEWRWMLKFAVFILGAGPGIRNVLTVLL